MDKLHTHYDNLKIARGAPQEVIRAAYKVLSQKYHPDKNPGDEKAARIMAIINSAYNTLSDEQRRKEHDEWISAEEWEIEWLESTKHEENEALHRATEQTKKRGSGKTDLVQYKPSRDPKWWLILFICLSAGWLGSFYMNSGTALFQSTIKSEQNTAENWALSKSILPAHDADKVMENKVIVLSQVRLSMADGRCAGAMAEQARTAPNGAPWPGSSGYIDGYPIDNEGGYTSLTLDNSANATSVYLKVFDVNAGKNVRNVFVAAHDKFLVDKLLAGNYELYRQDLGGPTLSQAECDQRKKRASRQASRAQTPAG